MISDFNQLAYECVGLDLAKSADFDSLLDLHEWSDTRMVTDIAFIEVDGFDNNDFLAEDNIPDSTLFQDGTMCHWFTSIEITIAFLRSEFG